MPRHPRLMILVLLVLSAAPARADEDKNEAMDAVQGVESVQSAVQTGPVAAKPCPGCTTVSPENASSDSLYFHQVRLDPSGGILPWCPKTAPGDCYDRVVKSVFNFWDGMNKQDTINSKGEKIRLPGYMLHAVWTPNLDDHRGIGGDQFAMALSSWRLLYAYDGDPRVKKNMKFIADYYLDNSLSPKDALWANLPYPCNVDPVNPDPGIVGTATAVYNGDMMAKAGVLQPDKAGSFGLELVHLYKMSHDDKPASGEKNPAEYLQAATAIARSLLAHVKAGDLENSPLPFKVNARTGEMPDFSNGAPPYNKEGKTSYTTNWSATMELFLEMRRLDPSHAKEYQQGFDKILAWMKAYPMKTGRWGSFFEDQPGQTDTQINAVTFARFILEHREYFPDWKSDTGKIFDWVYKTLGNDSWKKYGVKIVNEQTTYQFPGESHDAREGATELLYSQLSGDPARRTNALRQLNWATYMVKENGMAKFPEAENSGTNGSIWLTDGYGDYARHYLRAMAADPSIAPAGATHLLSTTSTIEKANYSASGDVSYRAYDSSGTEKIRMAARPASVLVDGKPARYQWTDLPQGGGVLEISRKGQDVDVISNASVGSATAGQ